MDRSHPAHQNFALVAALELIRFSFRSICQNFTRYFQHSYELPTIPHPANARGGGLLRGWSGEAEKALAGFEPASSSVEAFHLTELEDL